MNGKLFVSVLLAFCLVFGAALWWFQTRAFYQTVEGVTQVSAYGDAFPVSDYQGIDADTSPLKMRACFKVDWDYFPSESCRMKTCPMALIPSLPNTKTGARLCGAKLTNAARLFLVAIRCLMVVLPPLKAETYA